MGRGGVSPLGRMAMPGVVPWVEGLVAWQGPMDPLFVGLKPEAPIFEADASRVVWFETRLTSLQTSPPLLPGSPAAAFFHALCPKNRSQKKNKSREQLA